MHRQRKSFVECGGTFVWSFFAAHALASA